MWVRCPYCGRWFEVNMEKGKGAYYTRRDFRPTGLHKLILRAVKEIVASKQGGATKQEIERWLGERGRKISGNSLSGRLSELLGAGYLEVQYTEVRLYDEASKKYRFKKTPIWFLTDKGLQLLMREHSF